MNFKIDTIIWFVAVVVADMVYYYIRFFIGYFIFKFISFLLMRGWNVCFEVSNFYFFLENVLWLKFVINSVILKFILSVYFKIVKVGRLICFSFFSF